MSSSAFSVFYIHFKREVSLKKGLQKQFWNIMSGPTSNVFMNSFRVVQYFILNINKNLMVKCVGFFMNYF